MGSLEAADLGGEGGEAMTTTTIQEEMTTLTTSNSVRPAHITKNLSDKEKGGLLDEEKWGEQLLWTRIFKGGLVTPPTRRRSGRHGETEGAVEGEGDGEDGCHRRRHRSKDNNDGGGGGGDGRRQQSGHRSRNDRDDGEDGDGNNNEPIERL